METQNELLEQVLGESHLVVDHLDALLIASLAQLRVKLNGIDQVGLVELENRHLDLHILSLDDLLLLYQIRVDKTQVKLVGLLGVDFKSERLHFGVVEF